MINFEAVVERAINGPICTERDFDFGIFVPNLRRVLEKYGIKYDPQAPVTRILFMDGSRSPLMHYL